MIAKVTPRGFRPGKLLSYLMGPENGHVDQRVIATWDGAPELHQPPALGDGRFNVTDLTTDLSDPAVAAGISLQPGPGAPPVWHCSLRNAATDRVLSDTEWAQVAEELMDRTGIAPRGDTGACRWVAVRHAPDHIHVAAVLVRQDNGRRVYLRFDKRRAREVCVEAERRLGLTRTAPADRTAAAPPSRAELEKAARMGWPDPSRVWLRRVVLVAAVRGHDVHSFRERVGDLGALIELRYRGGQPIGYRVARPGDVTSAGSPVWFGGGSLASDMSLPKLQAQWSSAPRPAPPEPGKWSTVSAQEQQASVAGAMAATQQARAAVAAGHPDVHAIAHTTRDLLTSLCAVRHPGDIVTPDNPAALFDRAARQPGRGQPLRWPPVAQRLRSAAWRLMAVRALGHGADDNDTARLVLAVAALVAEIAAWQELNGHRAQAAAARAAATDLHRVDGNSGAGRRAPARSPSPTPTLVEPSGRGGRARGQVRPPGYPASSTPDRGRHR